DDMLRDQPWQEVAKFAASCCQCHVLGLKAWMAPPCAAHEDVEPAEYGNSYGNRRAEVELLRRMLSAGLSRFEPSPLEALERAEAEALATTPGFEAEFVYERTLKS